MNLQKSILNTQAPYKFHEIDLNKLVYSKIKSNKSKKIILIKYNDNNKLSNLVFQTPSLLNLQQTPLMNGVAEVEVALMGKDKLLLNKFINFLHDLENKVKQDAQINATDWFKLNNDNMNINFQKIIRESPKYQKGTLKLKMLINEDFETEIQYNDVKININEHPLFAFDKIESIDLDKKNELNKYEHWNKMLLECYAIWINANNDFGIFLRPIMVSYNLKEKEIYNYEFVEDSDDEDMHEIPDTEINSTIYTKINATTRILQNSGISNLIKNLNVTMEKNNVILEGDENDETSVFSTLSNENQHQNQINIDALNNNSNTSTDGKSNTPNIDAETSEI